MGAQGDQAAPKAPKLKAEAAQSLPKIAQSHPRTPKVIQKASKSGPKIGQHWEKTVPEFRSMLETIFGVKILNVEPIL